MTSNTRSPKEIERDIEEQRASLAANIEALQGKLSLEGVTREFSDRFREHGGEFSRNIGEQVKANPIPLALTALGLGWLMVSGTRNQDRSAEDPSLRIAEANKRLRQDEERRLNANNRQSYATGVIAEPHWARSDDHHSADGQSFSEQVDAAKGKVSEAAGNLKDRVSSGGDSIKERASEARRRIADGTENLSEEGRKRVIAMREKALDLRDSANRRVSDGADKASDFYDRQPLVVGALALAVGAAFGGALPRTKTEDDLLGSKRDELFHEAERIFQEEKSKAESVAQSVKEEVKDIASETKEELDSRAPDGKTSAEHLQDKAKDAANRVSDAAERTAENEKHGKPKL